MGWVDDLFVLLWLPRICCDRWLGSLASGLALRRDSGVLRQGMRHAGEGATLPDALLGRVIGLADFAIL